MLMSMDTAIAWLRSAAAERVLVILGLLLVLFASTYKLSESPAIWYDEGFYTQLSMNVARGHGQVLQIAPDTYVSSWGVTLGYPLVAPVALFYKAFGFGVLQGRAVMPFFILGLVVASWFFVRRLYGRGPALAALFLLGTFPVLYGNGKTVLGEVPGLFFLVLALHALLSLERSDWRDMRWYVAAGIATALCVVTKPIYLLLLPAGFVALLVTGAFMRLQWRGALAGAAALIALMVLWIYLEIGPGDSFASVLAYYANPYEYTPGGVVHLIIENLLRFVKEMNPLYTLLLVGSWMVGGMLRLRAKERITAAEWTAFAFSVLVILAFLRTPGWYRYFFPATIVGFLFAPYAVQYIYDALSRAMPTLARSRSVLVVLVIFLALAQAYQLAFSSFVASYYKGGRTAALTAYLGAIDPSTSIFIYNVPEVAVMLGTQRYYQYLTPHEHQHFGDENLTLLAQHIPDLVIVNAETYKLDPTPFSGYGIKDTVNRYYILKRL